MKKGWHHSKETKQKMSKAHFGKKLLLETRKKISLAHKGKHLSEETKRKIARAYMGEKHWNWLGISNEEKIVRKRIIDKEYQKRKRRENPGYKTEEFKNYRIRFPEKVKAQHTLNVYVRKGIIKKQPCVDCGEDKKVHAHHDDYSKPLDVRWLCAIHHKQAHKKI